MHVKLRLAAERKVRHEIFGMFKACSISSMNSRGTQRPPIGRRVEMRDLHCELDDGLLP